MRLLSGSQSVGKSWHRRTGDIGGENDQRTLVGISCDLLSGQAESRRGDIECAQIVTCETAGRRLDGRTALVTGGAGGIGTVIVEALARAGARTVSLDNRLEHGQAETAALNARLAGAAPSVSFIAAAHVHDAAVLLALHVGKARLHHREGRVGVDTLHTLELRQVVAVHWLQRIDCSIVDHDVEAAETSRGLTDGGRGGRRICQVGGITLNGGWKDFTAYVASKGTLLGLTRSLARELGDWNIRVNAVSPGAIPTALETEVWGDQIERYTAFVLERQALKYRGAPSDVAGLVLFLCSDAGRFITGQNINIDGGWWMT